MSLNADILNILACPKCTGDLELLEDETGLVCNHCKLVYPIKDDIPVLLLEDARPAPEKCNQCDQSDQCNA